MPSSISTAALVETCLENLLYGVYAVLFTTVIYLFRSRREGLSGRRPARWVLLGLITQFLVITAHWVNTLYNIFFAIVHLGGGAAAEAFYLDLSTPSSVLDITLLGICAIVTDLLVIHRLYVISSHGRKVVVFPLALLVGQIVCASSIIRLFITWDGIEVLYSLTNGWVTTNLVLSIMISTYSSGMIAWKILRISRGLHRLSEHIGRGVELTSLLATLVESAALQTTTSIGILVTFQVGFVGQTVLAGIAPAVFGISTVLIHARIGLGWAHDPDRQIGSNSTRINFARNKALEEHELEDRLRK